MVCLSFVGSTTPGRARQSRICADWSGSPAQHHYDDDDDQHEYDSSNSDIHAFHLLAVSAYQEGKYPPTTSDPLGRSHSLPETDLAKPRMAFAAGATRFRPRPDAP